MVASYWLALCFQASHVVSEVSTSYLTMLCHGICSYKCSFLPTSIPLNTSQLKNKMVSQAYLSGLYSKILISQDTAYTSPFLSGLSFVEGSHVFSRLLH